MMEALTLKGWWVVAIMVLLICIVIFTICYRMIKLCYQSNQDELHLSNINRRLSYSALSLLILALIIGFWQPAILRDIIDKIAMF